MNELISETINQIVENKNIYLFYAFLWVFYSFFNS